MLQLRHPSTSGKLGACSSRRLLDHVTLSARSSAVPARSRPSAALTRFSKSACQSTIQCVIERVRNVRVPIGDLLRIMWLRLRALLLLFSAAALHSVQPPSSPSAAKRKSRCFRKAGAAKDRLFWPPKAGVAISR